VMFTVNPEAAQRAGFTAEDLGTIGVAMVEGEPAAAPVLINDRPYPVRVRYPSTTRSSLEAMTNTMIVSSSGGTSTLGSVSHVEELPGQIEIRRENLQRLVEVTARLEGIDMGTGVAAVQKAVADLKLPPAIRVEYGGTYREAQKSFRDLTMVLVLAIVLIFLVLLFEFRSFTPPLAILSSAILSTSGVFLALLITRTTFNVSSFMGLIMVIGIVAKNGILLLDADENDGTCSSGWHAAARPGARCRIADAAAIGDRGDWRHSDLDDPVAHHHAGDSVFPDKRKRDGLTAVPYLTFASFGFFVARLRGVFAGAGSFVDWRVTRRDENVFRPCSSKSITVW
jgi:multidrug efflux pump subunit AcrB